MNQNIKIAERIARYTLGIVLLTWAIAGGPAWTYVGLFLIVTASLGSCPLYWILRINSRT